MLTSACTGSGYRALVTRIRTRMDFNSTTCTRKTVSTWIGTCSGK